MANSVKTFNQEMNVLKAIGIILVLGGHCGGYNLFTDFFPAYSFHMALFFFVSGYFFKRELFDNDKKGLGYLQFVAKKFKSLIVPYFCYNLFFAGMTVVLFKLTSNVYGQLPTLYNFFITPFGSAHQYMISCPLWFVTQLFMSLCVFFLVFFLLKKIWDNKFFHLVIFLVMGFVPCIISHHGDTLYGAKLVLFRLLFSMCFIYSGYFYKIYLESKMKFNLKWLGICLVIQSLLWIAQNKDLVYVMSWMCISNAFLPVLTSFTGIYVSIFTAKMIAPLVKKGSFLDLVGKNTYHIMALHLFVFFCLSVVIYAISGLDLKTMPDNIFAVWYKPQQYKYFYIVVALIVTTYLGVLFKLIKARIQKGH